MAGCFWLTGVDWLTGSVVGAAYCCRRWSAAAAILLLAAFIGVEVIGGTGDESLEDDVRLVSMSSLPEDEQLTSSSSPLSLSTSGQLSSSSETITCGGFSLCPRGKRAAGGGGGGGGLSADMLQPPEYSDSGVWRRGTTWK